MNIGKPLYLENISTAETIILPFGSTCHYSGNINSNSQIERMCNKMELTRFWMDVIV
jgi:hypothetical protein